MRKNEMEEKFYLHFFFLINSDFFYYFSPFLKQFYFPFQMQKYMMIKINFIIC